MTEMVVNTNLEKKKLTFSSTKVAFGEKVIVLFPDLYEQIGGNIPSDLRLRVLFLGKTIARFPYNKEDAWDNAGVLKCELNLNTNIAQNIKGIVECEFILDNVDESILYGVGYKEMLPWKKEAGEDVPYNLTDYPDILNEFREDIKKNNAAQVGLIEEYNLQSDKKYNDFKSEVETDIKDFKSDVEKTEEEIEKSLNNKYSTLESRVNTSLRDYTTLAQTQNSNIDKYKEEIKNKEEEFKSDIRDRVENFISKTSKDNSNFKNSINNNIAEFKTDVSTQVIEEEERAQKAESDLSNRIETIVASDVNKSARAIAAEEVAKVVANAPADLDTLKEIADYIESDKTGAAQMVAKIDANAKAIDAAEKRAQDAEAELGKSLDTVVRAEVENDSDTGELNAVIKLPTEAGKASKVVVGKDMRFNGRLYARYISAMTALVDELRCYGNVDVEGEMSVEGRLSVTDMFVDMIYPNSAFIRDNMYVAEFSDGSDSHINMTREGITVKRRFIGDDVGSESQGEGGNIYADHGIKAGLTRDENGNLEYGTSMDATGIWTKGGVVAGGDIHCDYVFLRHVYIMANDMPVEELYPRYKIIEVIGSEDYVLYSNTINIVSKNYWVDEYSPALVLPHKIEGLDGARDFVVVTNGVGTVAFAPPEGEDITFFGDEITVEEGKNLLISFTEVMPSKFLVRQQELVEVAQ